jgi:hypothetical protein
MSAGSLAAAFDSCAPLDAKAHHQEAWTLDVNAPIDSHAHIGRNRGNNPGEVIASFAISMWMHSSIIVVAILTTVVSSLMPYCMPPPPPVQPIQKVDVKVVELAPPPKLEEPAAVEVGGRAKGEAGAIGLATLGKRKAPKRVLSEIKEAELHGILGVLSSSSESSAIFGTADLSANRLEGGVVGGLIGSELGEGYGRGGLGLRGTGTGGGGTGEGTIGFGSIGRRGLDTTDSAQRDAVQRVIRASVPKITACYKTAGSKKEGRTVLLIRIDDDGGVASATLAPPLDSELDECILSIVRGLSFPKGKATIRYPLVFRRA